ncbi:MAG: hypothetical protein WCX64_02860 [Candidatus Micrarchaeia archaeon]
MEKILASAPGRMFLSGEAAFEYGAKALSLPVEAAGKRNGVLFAFQETPGKFVAYSGQKLATLVPNGRIRGDDELRPYLDAAKKALAAVKVDLSTTDTSFAITLDPNFPQSTGLSTSLCSALFSGFFSYYAEQADARGAFAKAFSTGGADSIIDADVALMASDSAMVFGREFLLDGSVSLSSKKTAIRLPEGTTLLYAEPADAQDRRGEIQQMVSSFQGIKRASGKAKDAKQMTSDERAKAGDAFSSLTARLSKELSSASPSPEKAAIYLECEHELLAAAGAVSNQCQAAAASAKKVGALAAKSSGFYGGVLAFCYEDDSDAVADALSASKLLVCGPLSISKMGATAVPA